MSDWFTYLQSSHSYRFISPRFSRSFDASEQDGVRAHGARWESKLKPSLDEWQQVANVESRDMHWFLTTCDLPNNAYHGISWWYCIIDTNYNIWSSSACQFAPAVPEFHQRWWPLELNLRISKSIRIDLLVAYTAGCCKHCASICDVNPRTLHCLSDEAMQRMDLSMQTCEGAKKMPFDSFDSGKCSNIHYIWGHWIDHVQLKLAKNMGSTYCW